MRSVWKQSVVVTLIYSASILRPFVAIAAEQGQAETRSLELSAAIDRGLAFLSHQQRPDGSFDAAGPPAAASGLALLAFLASGHTPELGNYGLAVRAALASLLSQADDIGAFGRDGDLYSHCVAMIALAQASGTELDETQRLGVRAALDKGLLVIYAAQVAQPDDPGVGGWRSGPTASDSDMATSGWCMLAIYSSHNAGISIPRQRIDRALAYMRRCYIPAQNAFARAPGAEPSVALTALALLQLHLFDDESRPEAAAAARYLVDHPVVPSTPDYDRAIFFTTQAAFQAYDRAWAPVWKNNSDRLLAGQRKDDGSWPAADGLRDAARDDRPARFASTAMSVLSLSVPLRLLPLYQR